MAVWSEGEVTQKIERLCIARYGNLEPNSMRALLMSYDGDGDGRLDINDVTRLLNEAGATNPFKSIPNAIMSKMDTDPRDGTVSWEEFVTVSPAYAGADNPNAPAAAEPVGDLLTMRVVKPTISERGYIRTVRLSANTHAAQVATVNDEGPSTGLLVFAGASVLAAVYFMFGRK